MDETRVVPSVIEVVSDTTLKQIDEHIHQPIYENVNFSHQDQAHAHVDISVPIPIKDRLRSHVPKKNRDYC